MNTTFFPSYELQDNFLQPREEFVAIETIPGATDSEDDPTFPGSPYTYFLVFLTLCIIYTLCTAYCCSRRRPRPVSNDDDRTNRRNIAHVVRRYSSSIDSTPPSSEPDIPVPNNSRETATVTTPNQRLNASVNTRVKTSYYDAYLDLVRN